MIVEGKSDFYYLRYFSDILNLGHEMHFAPGGGAGSLDTLISLYVGWARNFVVLLDDDSEGRAQRERYEQTFGPFVSGRCKTLRDLAGAGVREIEGLLTSDDRISVLAAVHGTAPRYTKKALLAAVLELYARGEAVELSMESTDRISGLLGRLSDELSGATAVDVDAHDQTAP